MRPRSRAWLQGASLAAGLVSALLAPGVWTLHAARAAADRMERTIAWTPGATLAIRVGAGTVKVSGVADRRDVRVRITREGASSALTAAAVAVVEGDGRVHIDAAPAAGRDVQATVLIDAPADVVVDDIAIDEGRLELAGLRGQVRAAVTKGAIAADDIGGVVRLETTMGPVTVTRASLPPGGLLRLRTFNGDVALSFAAPPRDARLMALALNGTVQSTLPLTMATAWGPRWGEASIGRADRVVSIDVVTGAIRIDAPAAR